MYNTTAYQVDHTGNFIDCTAVPTVLYLTIYPMTWASTFSRARFVFLHRETKSSRLTAKTGDHTSARFYPVYSNNQRDKEGNENINMKGRKGPALGRSRLTICAANPPHTCESTPTVQNPIIIKD